MTAERNGEGSHCSHLADGCVDDGARQRRLDEKAEADGTTLTEAGATSAFSDAEVSIGRQAVKSFHIAPMVNVTYREFRQLMRILSKRAVVWKEMVVDATVIHAADPDFYLQYERHNSHPIVCQVGGNDPDRLRAATQKVLEYGYDEVNLNMGCPSKLVADRNEFGAVLMKRAAAAESALKAMREAVDEFAALHRQDPSSSSSPPAPTLSVKCRIGVDDLDSLDDLISLISTLSPHCRIFYLHARKAVLGGILSPIENRLVPPLNYPRVYDICKMFPTCDFYINGGITNLKSARDVCFGRADVSEGHGVPCKICNFHNGSCVTPPFGLAPANLRGCMVGRVARDNPCLLWDVDRVFFGEDRNPCQNRKEVLEKYCAYLDTIYPRRCCDNDARVTKKIIDDVPFDFEYDCCTLCADLRGGTPPDLCKPVKVGPSRLTTERGVKVTSYVMGRAVKPIMTIFFGLPMGRQFRREVEQLVRNVEVRNCGPAALIRRALRNVPVELLEKNFESAI